MPKCSLRMSTWTASSDAIFLGRSQDTPLLNSSTFSLNKRISGSTYTHETIQSPQSHGRTERDLARRDQIHQTNSIDLPDTRPSTTGHPMSHHTAKTAHINTPAIKTSIPAAPPTITIIQQLSTAVSQTTPTTIDHGTTRLNRRHSLYQITIHWCLQDVPFKSLLAVGDQ